MLSVVFLCTENSNRSQMAEAFARRLGEGVLRASSAGSKASGMVNPKAFSAMAERGYDLSAQRSKSTDELRGSFDVAITMGCGDQCPWLPATYREDWQLDDPREMDPAAYNQVRDDIERRVEDLVMRVRQGAFNPSRAEHIFYDGHCGLCHHTVKWVVAHDHMDDGQFAFRFAPLQGPTFAATKPPGDLPDSVIVLTRDGRFLARSAGVIHILKRLGGPWSLLSRLLWLVPRPLRDLGYDAVARVRAKIWKMPDGVCPMLPPALRQRFDP